MPDRRDILRGVYEENLRTVRREPAPRKPVPTAQRPARRGWAAAFAALLVVSLAGVGYGSLQADPPAAALTPAAGADSAFLPEPAMDGPLSVADLYGLQVKTIVIDPGHGGRDPGTMGRTGLMEKEITMDVAKRLKRRLELAHDYRVLLTRDGDQRLPLRARARFANEHDADLFLSIHVNWLPTPDVNVVETYYFDAEAQDDKTARLAERENRGSDFSTAEWRSMLDDVKNTMRVQESAGVAEALQRRLYAHAHDRDPATASWGVKTAPFIVLLAVDAPGVLAEIGCISNPAEEARLATGAYREEIAAALERGIADYLGSPVREPAAE